MSIILNPANFALDRFAHLGFVRFFSGTIPKSVQCSKFTFLYNETLENIINYELGIEKVFYKSLSLNKLKIKN
jgi:hypothetical protein